MSSHGHSGGGRIRLQHRNRTRKENHSCNANLDYVLGRIRATFEENQRRHFCLMKKRVRLVGESARDYQYAINRQALVTQDLMRLTSRRSSLTTIRR